MIFHNWHLQNSMLIHAEAATMQRFSLSFRYSRARCRKSDGKTAVWIVYQGGGGGRLYRQALSAGSTLSDSRRLHPRTI
jgi:hypothetical protein